jgi:hypothetical protein
MQKVIFNTNGTGYWSACAKPVEIVNIELGYSEEELQYGGELMVYFNTSTWDVNADGLIYTDSKFAEELRGFLTAHGLPGAEVSYSEQGMQGDDYVSLDASTKFVKAWIEKFGEACLTT